jgi:hypothetical protein
MADPAAASATQLRNIEEATGMTMAQFASAIQTHGLGSHGQMVAFLKAEYGLSHGNANAVAHKVREMAAGGPAPAADLLAAQYAGSKSALRPICDRLTEVAAGMGSDTQIVVQKTGVALRRRKQFGVISAPSARRVSLGLNLDRDPDDPRVVATPGAMCAYRVDLASLDDIDADLRSWLRAAYERAG